MNTVKMQLDITQLQMIRGALLSAAAHADSGGLHAKANECRRLHDTIRHEELRVKGLPPAADPDELLKKALAAFNHKPNFKVPALKTDSYAIAAEIDAYFRQGQ